MFHPKSASRLLPLLLPLVSWPVAAQTAAPTPTPTASPSPTPLISPEIGADRRVTFRFRAPAATSVKLSGEWDAPEPTLVKDPNGVWSATIGPIPPDIYGYSFNVDGVSVLDSQNTRAKPARSVNTSILEVPGPKAAPVDAFPNVPRGTVHLHDYESKALGTSRRLRVYTPAGYENGRGRFPILYLLHGSGDNEATWTEFGRAHVILDNLIAARRAVPMIVVMTDGHAFIGQGADSRARNAADFERDLLGDVMPLVEKRYRVRAERDHRAIAGLSMGGNQALLTGLNHRDLFAYIGGMSSAIREPQAPLARFWADPNSKKVPLRLLWISIGKDDFLLEQNRTFNALLSAQGVPHSYRETEGAHRWTVWRRYLADLAPLLFVARK